MSIQNMKRSETTEQIALFNWAKRTESILPELALMYHVPNEGKRSNGGILKAAGLKSGVPDICLPVANNGFHGLYIELKFGKNKATKAQEEYMAMLNAQGYKTAVCYGAEEAGEEILAYLTEPGRMPKKACVNAPWINGKCDGINLPSRMFSREECRGCKNFNPGREERIINEILSEHPEKREIKQAIGFKGIVKKIMVFVVIAVAYNVQRMTGDTIPLREIVIVFFICNEALSILENAAEFINIPQQLKDVLLQLRDKNAAKAEEKEESEE